MARIIRISALLALAAMSSFAQSSYTWRTAADIVEGVRGTIVGSVVDVDSGTNRLQIEPDDDRYGRIPIITDSVSTQYNGFGTVINGQPEIFTGSSGFANVRIGDRVEVRGSGTGSRSVRADHITLVGRSVSASQVGVGQTRTPGSVSTPTTTTTATSRDRLTRVEGLVRQINIADGRIVIETDDRELMNVRAGSATPVYYRSATYRVRDIELGDRVRVDIDPATTSDREIRARAITVTESVQDRGEQTPERRQFTVIEGRVASVDRSAQVVTVNTGRNDVRVDVGNANGPDGRQIRVADLRTGDDLRVMGNYGENNTFVASSISFNEDVTREPAITGFAVVSISATVVESLSDSPQLVVRERTTNRTYSIWVTEDFIVRTKSGSYAGASTLKENDSVLIKAYRDELGNYVAQTIRVR
ncbi:MAG TPA: hypothetical protein VN181_04810 [Thermoanaerobaculia bacterium]|nr:hypothetical protein [Thermoanaerobaculia bacterium]